MVNTKNNSSYMEDLISLLFGSEEDFNIFMDELKKKTKDLEKVSEPKSGYNDSALKEAPEDYLTDANDLYIKKDPKSKSDTVNVACELTDEEKAKLSDKRVCAVSKESIKAILELWRETEKLVFKLTKEFGINIWESQDDTIYNKFNLMIRQFLEIMFTSAEVDILEDWTFGYQDIENHRPDFNEVWKGILDE